MKKQKVAKRKPLSMVIDLKRLIEESGVSYNSSIPDKLIVSSELIKKISFDIYHTKLRSNIEERICFI
ncbi:MAG TPA: hypothetical protein PLE30_11120 [Candidatus Kapabacteria bacterium]|nr:hypothetical protein [Candidatus Kapabacteria bacterium]